MVLYLTPAGPTYVEVHFCRLFGCGVMPSPLPASAVDLYCDFAPALAQPCDGEVETPFAVGRELELAEVEDFVSPQVQGHEFLGLRVWQVRDIPAGYVGYHC